MLTHQRDETAMLSLKSRSCPYHTVAQQYSSSQDPEAQVSKGAICNAAAFALLLVIATPHLLWGQEIEYLKRGVVKITSRVEGQQDRVGTGFIVRLENDRAYIVTASHVIEGDPQPTVTFYLVREKQYTGKVLGIEGGDSKGLAAILVQGKLPVGLEVLLVNQTVESTAGEAATVIGFPSKTGMPWTVSTGSLSGIKGRDLAFTALVDDGNSGGPVLVRGMVVGVVIQAKGEFGLAVPSLTVKLTLRGWGVEVGGGYSLRLTTRPGRDGWTLSFDVVAKGSNVYIGSIAKEIFYKLPQDVNYRSTGFYPQRGETGLPTPKNSVEVPELRERSFIQVKYLNVYGEEEGPYELVFDPVVEWVKYVKSMLALSEKWVSYLWDGRLLVYFSHLVGYATAMKEILYSVDNDSLNQKVKFQPRSVVSGRDFGVFTDDQLYTELPRKTKFVVVKLIFKDGTESDLMKFPNDTGSDREHKGLILASISAGKRHTCGITPAGAAYCWGRNQHGELGNDSEGTRSMLPRAVQGNIKWLSIDLGEDHTCGIASDGHAYCWGSNEKGQLGDGSYEDRKTPVPVATDRKFSALAAGKDHTCALSVDGAAYCWGGDSKMSSGSAQPLPVSGDFKFKSLSAGGYNTYGITSNANLYRWGGSPDSLKPKQDETHYISVSAGVGHVCGITTDGFTLCRGNNFSKQLGVDDSGDALNPVWVKVSGNLTFTAVTAGEGFTCGLTSAGSVYCWGNNTVQWSEESVTGSAARHAMPRRLRGSEDLNFKALAVGGSGMFDAYACGLTDEGAAYCWGSGEDGKLGNGLSGYFKEPTLVLDPTQFQS